MIAAVAVVVYSETGTTLAVARRIARALADTGISAELITVGQGAKTADLSDYRAAVLGAPVRGFDLAPPMADFLSRSAGLGGLRVYCFVTQAFPFKAWGATQALARMASICRAKGAEPRLLDAVSRTRGYERAAAKLADDILHAFA